MFNSFAGPLNVAGKQLSLVCLIAFSSLGDGAAGGRGNKTNKKKTGKTLAQLLLKGPG